MDFPALFVWWVVPLFLVLRSVDWVNPVATLVAGLVPGGIALWVALSERRRSDALRRADRLAADEREEHAAEAQWVRQAEDRRTQLIRDMEERAQQDGDRRRELRVAATLELDAAAVRMLSAWRFFTLARSRESGVKEMGQAAEAFVISALRMYIAEPDDEDLHARIWVDQFIGRYREIAGIGRMTVPGIEWAMESTTVPELIASATRRLDLWARGQIGAKDLSASMKRLTEQFGLWRLDDQDQWQSPLIHGGPSGFEQRTTST
jgi:hypothetical protein